MRYKLKLLAVLIPISLCSCFYLNLILTGAIRDGSPIRQRLQRHPTLNSSRPGRDGHPFCSPLGSVYTNPKWDFRRFTRPQFLSSYKNPCFLGRQTKDNVTKSVGRVLHCLPYFLVAGFPKAGTTDLWQRLSHHPEIMLKHRKEPNFLNLGRFRGPFEVITMMYMRLLGKSAVELQRLVAPLDCGHPFPYHHGITGEATVDAAFSMGSWRATPGNENCSEPRVTNAQYAAQLNPGLKVLFLTRDPVERIYSDYIYEARFLRYPTSPQLFHKAVTRAIKMHNDCRKHSSLRACAYNNTLENYQARVRVGLYHVYIRDWIETFSRAQVLVVRSEDTIALDTREHEYNRMLKFLDVRPFTRNEQAVVFNLKPSNARRQKEIEQGDMLPATRRLLEDFYRPHNAELHEMFPEIDYLYNDVPGTTAEYTAK
ncbi:carbohydrate sulfotransferase 15-like [Mya arenaria]|uniref:carbohydrate sulfotransferase 15-like n=1 Tax=Mya arenaria TaxID=6604 RepID=UPI0022E35AA7|nr:carbohydrate sulfotransferase 15-like [Mya arenaria]